MTTTKLLVIAACIAYCPSVLAESDTESVHFAAHFGLSYAITTTLYGFSRQGLRMSPVQAAVFAGFVTFTGGFFRQAIQPQFNGAGVFQNVLGIGAALGTVYVFHF